MTNFTAEQLRAIINLSNDRYLEHRTRDGIEAETTLRMLDLYHTALVMLREATARPKYEYIDTGRQVKLHYLDGKTPSFRLGLYTVVVSAPHGIVRKSYPLTDLQPNLLNPAATPITLNGAASQLTARLRQAQQAEQERTESAIRAVVKETSAILDEIIKSASGLYCTPEVQPGGSTIYYLHDKPTAAASKNIFYERKNPK